MSAFKSGLRAQKAWVGLKWKHLAVNSLSMFRWRWKKECVYMCWYDWYDLLPKFALGISGIRFLQYETKHAYFNQWYEWRHSNWIRLTPGQRQHDRCYYCHAYLWWYTTHHLPGAIVPFSLAVESYCISESWCLDFILLWQTCIGKIKSC